MALTKFATFEDAEVLDVKSSPNKVKTASLRTLSDFHDYNTDDGYLYVRIRAISSRTNKNNDGWPTAELAGGSEAWERISSQHTAATGGFTVEAGATESEYGFPTFIHKPIFVDHNNSNPDRTRGAIVDSKFNVLDKKTAAAEDEYWGGDDVDPEHFPPAEVELLLEIDAKEFPKFAKAVVNGDIDGFSMGCDVDYSKCSHCGHVAHSMDEYCSHIAAKGAEHDYHTSDGKKISKKSYENCYGIKFFEISGVFDPADETALTKEIRSSVHKEATATIACPQCGQYEGYDPIRGCIHCGYKGIQASETKTAVSACPMCGQPGGERQLDFHNQPSNVIQCPQGHRYNMITGAPVGKGYGAIYQVGQDGVGHSPVPNSPDTMMLHANTKTSEHPEPQVDHIKAPEDVNTLREEKVCPLCGSDMDDVKCDVCGFEEPPESLSNPDLSQAADIDVSGEADGQVLDKVDGEDLSPNGPDVIQDSPLNARNKRSTGSVISDMRWTPKGIDLTKLAAPKPQGDEPNETVTSDQTTPVTSTFRTAQELIASAAAKRNQETDNMSDQTKVAAEPADQSGKPTKRVDVEGVGGVIDATNEQASKPTGQHDYENAGKTVDVTGKGGVIEDSNAEASKPSVGTESVDKEVRTDDSGPTKTWDNSNEPGSAVTDKAVQSNAVEAAKGGNKPIGGADVQPERREDLEQESGFSNPQKGTDQWTGTGGNGVTRQADPVTSKPTQSGGVKASGLISLAALKLADTEVELGITPKDKKFDRLAELSELDEAEVIAEHRALAKVRTASTTRTAAAGGTTRLPNFGKIARDEPVETPTVTNDELDSALFTR